jgi:hypothetical protein
MSINLKIIQPKTATLILIGITFIAALIVTLWAIGIGAIDDFFAYLNLLQESPPMWIEAPMMMGKFILAPAFIAFVSAIIITKVFPEPSPRSRFIVIAIIAIIFLVMNLSTLLKEILSLFLCLFFDKKVFLGFSINQNYSWEIYR